MIKPGPVFLAVVFALLAQAGHPAYAASTLEALLTSEVMEAGSVFFKSSQGRLITERLLGRSIESWSAEASSELWQALNRAENFEIKSGIEQRLDEILARGTGIEGTQTSVAREARIADAADLQLGEWLRSGRFPVGWRETRARLLQEGSTRPVRLDNSTPVLAGRASLAEFAPSWRVDELPEAGSEQAQPVYLGLTPREMALGMRERAVPALASGMRAVGEKQALEIARALGQQSLELEAWPTEEDGIGTWAFARWRVSANDDWKWLDSSSFKQVLAAHTLPTDPAPVLPTRINPATKRGAADLFNDFLEMKGLYDKPSFGDAVWTTRDGSAIRAAWLPTAERAPARDLLSKDPALLQDLRAWVIPQPARLNAKPVTFTLEIREGVLQWPKLHWVDPMPIPESVSLQGQARPLEWPESFKTDYERDLKIFSGEESVVCPIGGKCTTFTRKNSADPEHQLEELLDYFEQRYHLLGLQTERMRFTWRGIQQSNLLVKIKGSLPPGQNRPYILADHIDTAFAEDVYRKKGVRVAVPGADDNGTAVATLLRAAETLKGTQPLHDIWLLHLTGEEYPADDLGVRYFLRTMRITDQDIQGVVLIDMAGHNQPGGRIFQINPGNSPHSARMAAVAYQAATEVAPGLKATMRARFDDRSYLYNTDGAIFEREGYPVVFINENMNRYNLDRKGYHDMTDVVKNVDLDYAVSVAKTAIEAIHRLANVR